MHAAVDGGTARSAGSSRLLSIRNGTLAELGSYEGSYSFTASANGTVLGRLDRYRPGAGKSDLLIKAATGDAVPINLGHYDCFNHFIGIEGAPEHYFLQGTPPDGHKRKRLCRLDGDGTITSLWPVLDDDGTDASHAMECFGCHLEDTAGAGIVIAGIHHNPSPSAPKRGFIYRKPIDADCELWRQTTAAASSAMAYVAGAGVLAAAFLDGTLRLIDPVSGAIRAAGIVTVNGQQTVIYALAASEMTLAIGTFDGQVAVLDPRPLLQRGATIAPIELA